jgi:hypothetical protein
MVFLVVLEARQMAVKLYAPPGCILAIISLLAFRFDVYLFAGWQFALPVAQIGLGIPQAITIICMIQTILFHIQLAATELTSFVCAVVPSRFPLTRIIVQFACILGVILFTFKHHPHCVTLLGVVVPVAPFLAGAPPYLEEHGARDFLIRICAHVSIGMPIARLVAFAWDGVYLEIALQRVKVVFLLAHVARSDPLASTAVAVARLDGVGIARYSSTYVVASVATWIPFAFGGDRNRSVCVWVEGKTASL